MARRVPAPIERTATLGDQPVFWRDGGEGPDPGRAPVLYLHGVPTSSVEWPRFLARTGGLAPDLPGFGCSGKRGDGDFTIDGYADFVGAFLDLVEVDRVRLVVHDWGAAGLVWAQRHPERVERLVVMDAVPLLPGYRWHRIARAWRTRGVGEWVVGATTRGLLRRLPPADPRRRRPGRTSTRARSARSCACTGPARRTRLAQAGADLGRLDCPALVVHGDDDPFIPARFADDYAAALGGTTTVEHVPEAGHWPWHDDPGVVERVAAFLNA